ncbi:MAG: hypothetical protein KGN36_00175, partial [Acidobacteriota bacterium]|nr:hypothetical protein [Acidobacteriota bacterium]
PEMDGYKTMQAVREMPEEVHGHFVSLDGGLAQEMETAWKRVMILNDTQVLYSFRYEPSTAEFFATKR